MKHLISAMILILMGLTSFGPHAATRVVVGAYHFPPIVSVSGEEGVSGLLTDVLTALNDSQSDYHFEVLITSSKRRYMDFQQQHYDVIFFESPHWSWQDIPHQESKPFLIDEEVYVALHKTGRGQSFFTPIKQRKLVAMFGYHYGFANFSTDEFVLRRRFDIVLSHSQQRNIKLILTDRPTLAEVAVISRSFLKRYFRDNPEDRNLLMISDKADQRYELGALLRPDSPITVRKLEALLDPIIQRGSYQALVLEHGLQLPENLAQTSGRRAGTAP
ncbi:MAG: amino acid ABC transporter substrate-binding protein [Marinobacter sp.]|uniref:amino acid ABC transporter substrate-binding protein n=1 Tax=Marinobacter sp. TaxID=50741 RepID=UPI0034A08E76